MIPRILLAAAAIVLAAPAAFAQATPEAALTRFIGLANAGKLTTPEGQALLTGEARQMATDARSNLPAADKVLKASPTLAAARIVLRGAPGEEADAYFYLEKTAAGWAVSAYRQMALSGMDMALLAEMKKRPTLPAEDQIRKRNLELLLSTDSQLRAWFTANKAKVEQLPPSPARSALADLGLTSAETSAGMTKLIVGTSGENTVGFLRAGPSGPPPITLADYFWVEALGGGWYLFRSA